MQMRTVLRALAVAAMLTNTAAAGDWWDNVRVKGDLRYRHEMIDKEGKDACNRHRLRARIGVEANVSATTKVGFQLATGSDDPVSTNQTLDNGFSTKNLMLDLAYFETKHEAIPGLKTKGGKFKNPFFKPGESELLWDSDCNPEGGAATFQEDFQNLSLTLIGAGLWIEERSSDKDSWLAAGQAVVRYHLNDKKSSVAVGGGFFNYVNTAGFEPFFDSEEPMGNTVDDSGRYVNDYELLELFAEITHQFNDIPVVAIGDYVTNTAADSLDNGWLVGVRVGKTTKPGSWAFRYIYREVEKDAVVGTFTDSDFRGGGTDAKGHEIGGSVQVAENTAFDVTYFANTIGLNKEELGFSRLQVDLQLKFK
jgi:hypothetical protein